MPDATAHALRRTEQRLALALNAAGLGAWEFDLRTRYLTSSAQCKRNHGFGADADMQLEPHIIDAIPNSHRALFIAAIDRAIASRDAFQIEVPNRWPDGTDHWLLVAGRVVDETCMVGVSQDITERHRIEDALRESARQKEEFLAVLAHELRGPLAPILTAVRLLELKGPPDPELKKFRQTIDRQARQLTRLVDDLLDVGRIAAGKLRVQKDRIDLVPVVRQAVEAAGPIVERHGHRLTVTVPDHPVYVDGDAARLAQVAGNLLNNAAKYMPSGGRIEITLAEEFGLAAVRVQDDGIGIAPEMMERIFQRFVQLGSGMEGPEGGLGIGLSLVKVLVELHGGTVEGRSAGIGKGSEFTFRLPLAPAPDVVTT